MLSSIGLSIVLLQNTASMRSNEWKHNRVQKLANATPRRNPGITSLHVVKEHNLLFVQSQRSTATYESVNLSPSVDTLISVHTLSPDLNPIEQLWNHIKSKSKIKIRAQNVNNVHQLQQAITDEWNKLPVKFLHRTVVFAQCANSAPKLFGLMRFNFIIKFT